MKITSIILLILFISCTAQNKREVAIKEIQQAEKAFAQMAADSGVAKAFLQFAAPDAVLLRNEHLIIGQDEMKKFFGESTLTNVQLSWQAEFVEAAESGDLGYTYGKYTFSAIDTAGLNVNAEGIFHTVWRRQPDRQWHFVWD